MGVAGLVIGFSPKVAGLVIGFGFCKVLFLFSYLKKVAGLQGLRDFFLNVRVCAWACAGVCARARVCACAQ